MEVEIVLVNESIYFRKNITTKYNFIVKKEKKVTKNLGR